MNSKSVVELPFFSPIKTLTNWDVVNLLIFFELNLQIMIIKFNDVLMRWIYDNKELIRCFRCFLKWFCIKKAKNVSFSYMTNMGCIISLDCRTNSLFVVVVCVMFFVRFK